VSFKLDTHGGYSKDGGHSRTYFFNGNDHKGHCMTSKTTRVLSVFHLWPQQWGVAMYTKRQQWQGEIPETSMKLCQREETDGNATGTCVNIYIYSRHDIWECFQPSTYTEHMVCWISVQCVHHMVCWISVHHMVCWISVQCVYMIPVMHMSASARQLSSCVVATVLDQYLLTVRSTVYLHW